MISPSSGFSVPLFGATQGQSGFQRRSWVPTVDQVEWSISSHAILFRIDDESQSLGVFIPILLICIRDVHFQSSRQCLHHSVCCPIRLRSVLHGFTLFLPRDLIERSEEIGHKPWLSIVADRFTGPKSSKHTLLVTLSNRLRSSGGTCLGDHAPREQIHPQQQLGVYFKRSR